MEFRILYWLQGLHGTYTDVIMKNISTLGNNGLIWIITALLLLFFKKSRKCSFVMMLALFTAFIIGNCILKNAFMRSRPCWIDPTVAMLIRVPKDYSFPSGHTFAGFSAGAGIFCCNRKAGTAALIFAALIAFSRLYLFVHFPTDVLAGIVLGTATGILSYFCVNRIYRLKKKTV